MSSLFRRSGLLVMLLILVLLGSYVYFEITGDPDDPAKFIHGWQHIGDEAARQWNVIWQRLAAVGRTL